MARRRQGPHHHLPSLLSMNLLPAPNASGLRWPDVPRLPAVGDDGLGRPGGKKSTSRFSAETQQQRAEPTTNRVTARTSPHRALVEGAPTPLARVAHLLSDEFNLYLLWKCWTGIWLLRREHAHSLVHILALESWSGGWHQIPSLQWQRRCGRGWWPGPESAAEHWLPRALPYVHPLQHRSAGHHRHRRDEEQGPARPCANHPPGQLAAWCTWPARRVRLARPPPSRLRACSRTPVCPSITDAIVMMTTSRRRQGGHRLLAGFSRWPAAPWTPSSARPTVLHRVWTRPSSAAFQVPAQVSVVGFWMTTYWFQPPASRRCANPAGPGP